MTHRESVWAKNLIALQDEEGKWGQFHTLSWPSDKPVTTEQALRRLEILGCTAEDACIQKAVSYLHSCLIGEKCIPDPTEKLHNWDIYVKLMLSAWLCRFTKEDAAANAVAETWGKVITAAFGCGEHGRAVVVVAGGDGHLDADVGEALELGGGLRVVGGAANPQRHVAEHHRAAGTRTQREDLVDRLVEQRVLVGGLALHVLAADVDVAEEDGEVAVHLVAAQRRARGDRRRAEKETSSRDVHCISFRFNGFT